MEQVGNISLNDNYELDYHDTDSHDFMDASGSKDHQLMQFNSDVR